MILWTLSFNLIAHLLGGMNDILQNMLLNVPILTFSANPEAHHLMLHAAGFPNILEENGCDIRLSYAKKHQKKYRN